MVKNKVGGNKAKKYGRKHILGDNQAVKVRFTKEEGEMYAIVIKHYGQGRMDVLCEDDKIRSCVIRKKFRGRHRHNNKAVVGYFVMVGLRDWETVSKNKECCDLLETYDDQEKDRLIQRQPNIPFNNMIKRCNDLCGMKETDIGEDDNMIQFTSLDEESNSNEETINQSTSNENSNLIIDDIDFDDI
tara:strand:- start:2358 stop:2918 length:561 start_codon:yes stop_codon:yes gene_type:complete